MTQTGVVGGGDRLTDWISLGVLAFWVPRDAVDDAVAGSGRGARRAGGKLPPHVMVYLVMALALFADDDYEEVAARLTETLREWGCWEDAWEVPTSGGITQTRQRLGAEPVAGLFAQVAVPVAEEETAGAFLGPWRLMAVDGFEWDVPATAQNAAVFGFHGAHDQGTAAFPRARVVTISECGSHAVVGAALGGTVGKGTGEQVLARQLYPRLEEDWLLIAGRGFYTWKDWRTAADTGAALLWRVSSWVGLPVLELLPDGSCRSVLIDSAGRADHYDHRSAGRPSGRAGAGLPRKMGARDRQPAAENLPARAREGAAVQVPGHGLAGDLRLPADPLRDQRPDLPGGNRSGYRPRPGQVQTGPPHRAPPGR